MTEDRTLPMTGLATPTPWRVKEHKYSVTIYGPKDIEIVETSWHSSIRARYPLEPESKANVALIVEAVNSYASLKARIQVLEERELTTLAHFYKDSPLAVANLCDEVLDRSGALLGRVREKYRNAALQPQDKANG
jgi:hypothetical protein